MSLRLLCLADTHLGFDLPTRPRVRRRRRGHDFLANYERALAPALDGGVDLVVHGGDVFHRSRVPPTLVHQAFEPLGRLARAGVPVFVVPGNHERSRIPWPRHSRRPGVHVFDAPRTFLITRGGLSVAIAGFPYERAGVRSRFRELVDATGLSGVDADVALLCVHHCFEGATVGPADHVFRGAPDVVRARDVPSDVAAVLTGHVHRHQVLCTDLAGRPLAAPVLYPGSTERTSFAERGEPKGYLLVELETGAPRSGGRVSRWRFEELPARPMVESELDADGLGPTELRRLVQAAVRRVPEDSVLRLRLRGRIQPGALGVLGAERLRALAPAAMNLDVILHDEPGLRRARRAAPSGRSRDHVEAHACQLGLGLPEPTVGHRPHEARRTEGSPGADRG